MNRIITLTKSQVDVIASKGPPNFKNFLLSRRIKERDNATCHSWLPHDYTHIMNLLKNQAAPSPDKTENTGFSNYKPYAQYGAGTELKRLISKFGIKVTADCSCNNHVTQMNRKGIDWCENHVKKIVGWLKKEVIDRKKNKETTLAERIKLASFTEIGAGVIVRHAIKKARENKELTKLPPIFVSFFTEGNGYREEAVKLVETLKQFQLDYDVQSLGSFGKWQRNCQHKTAFILEMLTKHPGREVIWIDADCRLRNSPEMFSDLDCDIAGGWNSLGLWAGVIYINPTPAAVEALRLGIEENNQKPDERLGDQLNFQRVVERQIQSGKLRFVKIPYEKSQMLDIRTNAVLVSHGWVSRKTLAAEKAKVVKKPEDFTFCDRSKKPIDLTDLYKGSSCFLIAGGPSFANENHALLRQPGILTMALNNAAATFRPDLWAEVDNPNHFQESIWRDPKIMKFVPTWHLDKQVWKSNSDENAGIVVRDCPNVYGMLLNDRFVAEEFMTEKSINWGDSEDNGGGRTVMLAAIKILYVLGVRNVYLLGVDFKMNKEYRYHFKQDRSESSIKGNNHTYSKTKTRFAALRPFFGLNNFNVYNCNSNSELKTFDYIPFADAVRRALVSFPDVATENTEGLYERPGNTKK